MIKSLDDRVTLNNGTTMPGLGMGVFQIPNEQTAQVVAEGIKAGYRLIDTAQVYGNEAGTGAGIKAGLAATGLEREDLFITSKVWMTTFLMMKRSGLFKIAWLNWTWIILICI